MGIVYLYVGNYITGEIHSAAVCDDEETIANTFEGFWKDLGCDHVIWEIYNTAQPMDVREIQFNNRLDRAYHEYMEDVA